MDHADYLAHCKAMDEEDKRKRLKKKAKAAFDNSEKPKPKKVYCINCAYLEMACHPHSTTYSCRAPSNVMRIPSINDWLSSDGVISFREHPRQKNSYNNCKDYIRKCGPTRH